MNIVKQKVMRRVYVIYTVRELTSPLSLKAITLGACFFVGNSLVSIGQVVLNMPRLTDVSALSRFASSAFLQTDGAVQVLTVAALGLVVWMGSDVVRTFSTRSSFVPSGVRV